MKKLLIRAVYTSITVQWGNKIFANALEREVSLPLATYFHWLHFSAKRSIILYIHCRSCNFRKLRKFGIFCDLCLLCFSFVHQIFYNACYRYLNLSCMICDLGLVYFSSVHQLQLPRGYWHWGRRKLLHKEISIDPEKIFAA